ncbi:hypothetical protein GAR05_06389 [Micromonospora saelicesensis]|uniref:Uncharacterized protein n=2 Tax=Micromonospora saelicesensis TaxID=285676 RepID=A0ABX9C996_9ACTN|nr:hypothetical protein [Micromonospora saelicesensis]RAN92226.1 hypothetical protein GAR05_06389 [Micromonospora saelicesensis]
MGTDSWKGHLNGVLYGIQFDRVLDDSVVTRVVNGVTAGHYPGDRAATRDALDQALRSSGPLNDQAETHHSEDELRSFFRRLAAALSTPSPS